MKDYWEAKAESTLRSYNAMKIGTENVRDELAELEAQKNGIRSAGADGNPVHGGTSGRDSRIINLISMIDDMKKQLKEDMKTIDRTERALKVLNDEERMVLDRFYIIGERGAAERVAAELNVDVRTAYRKRAEALLKFQTAMTGKLKM